MTQKIIYSRHMDQTGSERSGTCWRERLVWKLTNASFISSLYKGESKHCKQFLSKVLEREGQTCSYSPLLSWITYVWTVAFCYFVCTPPVACSLRKSKKKILKKIGVYTSYKELIVIVTPSLSCAHIHSFSSDWKRRPCPSKYFDFVSMRVFMCLSTVISSIFGKSFHFPFPYFVIVIMFLYMYSTHSI